IKDRLDQLGPKPDATAPLESPMATAERASQQKIYADTSDVVKRAHVLAAEIEQCRASITSRQRRLFTRTMFTQAASIVSPSLWIKVIHEAPGTVGAVRAVFRDWFAGAKNRLEEHQDLSLFWGSMAIICLGYVLFTQFARRVLARSPMASEPG